MRSLQSAVPWTTTKMSTCSTNQQQQLGIAARSPQSTVPSDYRQNVDLLHQSAAAQGSCCSSSFTRPVWLWAFRSTTSSASYSTSGGISTGEQCIITESIRRQRIIVFTSTRSADPDLQKVYSALNWGFEPKFNHFLYKQIPVKI